MLLRLIPVLAVLWSVAASAAWPEHLGEQSVWDAAYDQASGARFIPTQLIIPSRWDGTREVTQPAATFMEPEGTRWRGPETWRDPYANVDLQVYDRRRDTRHEGSVVQKMALRSERDGIGRVYDSRIGESVCSNEVKFPLGVWKQGEIRRFDYTCLTRRGADVTTKKRASIVTIDDIDFVHQGIPHSLRFHWKYIDPDTAEVIDHRIYTFVPGLGLATEFRVP